MPQNEEIAMGAAKLMIDILLKMAETGQYDLLDKSVKSLDTKTSNLLLATALGEIAAHRGLTLGKPSNSVQDHIDGL